MPLRFNSCKRSPADGDRTIGYGHAPISSNFSSHRFLRCGVDGIRPCRETDLPHSGRADNHARRSGDRTKRLRGLSSHPPLLARWGILPEGSSKDDVAKLGIWIERVRAVAAHATNAILQQLTAHPTDLLVLSTHQREGLARLTHQAIAEPLARGTNTKTLFIPSGVEGFIAAETGRSNLT